MKPLQRHDHANLLWPCESHEGSGYEQNKNKNFITCCTNQTITSQHIGYNRNNFRKHFSYSGHAYDKITGNGH